MNDDDDEFYIPTGEELDRMEGVEKPRKRGLFARVRDRRGAKAKRGPALEVPDSVGTRRTLREPGRKDGDKLLDRSSSTGRVVRSIDASEATAKRDLVIPPELREKYGLDD